MTKFYLTLRQLDNEGVLDEVSLGPIQLWENGLGVLDVVLVHEVLRRVKRVVQRREVFAVVRRVLDQVLEVFCNFITTLSTNTSCQIKF